MEVDGAAQENLAQLTAKIVAAYVSNNQLERGAFLELIPAVMNGLQQASAGEPPPVEEKPPVPAVPIKKSVTGDFIVCLEDGKSFKSLKRHLMTRYGLSPNAYRQKWGLPADYPMVAPNYAAARSALARASGLGRKPKAEEIEEQPEPPKPSPKRRASRKVKQAA